MIVITDLCGLKSSGASWISMVDEILIDVFYIPSIVDMDVWTKYETNPKNGEEYYDYVLVYMDDLLHINHDR